MKLDRTKISENFEIPVNVYDELLDKLEVGLKEIETELDDDTVYLVINNIISSKYERNRSYRHMPKDELLRLTKTIIEGPGDKTLLPIWTITQD